MKRAVFLHLEQLLKDYSGINNFIAEIEKSPYFSVDDQRRIMTLKQEQNAVRDAISNTDNDTLETIDSLYFHHNPNQTLDGVAYDLNIAPSTLYYRRNKFLELVKNNLGW